MYWIVKAYIIEYKWLLKCVACVNGMLLLSNEHLISQIAKREGGKSIKTHLHLYI